MLAAAVLALLAGRGQKGPLFLPPPAQAASAPVPSPVASVAPPAG